MIEDDLLIFHREIPKGIKLTEENKDKLIITKNNNKLVINALGNINKEDPKYFLYCVPYIKTQEVNPSGYYIKSIKPIGNILKCTSSEQKKEAIHKIKYTSDFTKPSIKQLDFDTMNHYVQSINKLGTDENEVFELFLCKDCGSSNIDERYWVGINDDSIKESCELPCYCNVCMQEAAIVSITK